MKNLAWLLAFLLSVAPAAAQQACYNPQVNEQSFQVAVDFPVRTVTASFPFDATMYKIRANAASNPVTGTLPACTAALKGRTYILKKVDSSANAAIYATTGSDTIDGATGATAVSITTQYADVKVTCSDVVGAWDKGD